MNEHVATDRWFLDQNLTLLECGKASHGFFGILNWLNESRLNVPFYKTIFKSHLQIMNEDAFHKIQDQMKEVFHLYNYNSFDTKQQ